MSIELKALDLILALPLRKLPSAEKYHRVSTRIEHTLRRAVHDALEEAAISISALAPTEGTAFDAGYHQAIGDAEQIIRDLQTNLRARKKAG